MDSHGVPVPIIVAAILGAVSVLGFAVNSGLSSHKDRANRQREVFAQAFVAVVAYEEYPFVIRRRRASEPDGERIRISTDLRMVQEKLSFYSAWLKTESKDVSIAYEDLILEVRKVAGKLMREAWETPPIFDDSEMNMPDLSVNELAVFKEKYLQAVSAHLSAWPTWLARRS